MTKNRKMILALSILASGVSLFFSSPVLAREIFVGQICSVKEGTSKTMCGTVIVPKREMVTIKFDVPAVISNNFCFGVKIVPSAYFCTMVLDAQKPLILLGLPSNDSEYKLYLWAQPGGAWVKITKIEHVHLP